MTDAVAATRRWVEEVVIGLDLCPFARRPFETGTLAFWQARQRTPEAIKNELLQALADFLEAPPEAVETALFIAPEGLEAFGDYLDLLATVEDLLEESGLIAEVQVASFHPHYRFEDAAEDDPANYTNRSPYPMFHFIRQESLSRALEEFPEPVRIPERNMKKLRALGSREMEKRLARLLERLIVSGGGFRSRNR